MPQEIEILVEFTLRPGANDAFEQVLLPHLERVAGEPTCLQMIASRDPDDPALYMLYERWADKDEFWDVQMKREYRVPYNAALVPLMAAPRRVAMFHPLFVRQKPSPQPVPPVT